MNDLLTRARRPASEGRASSEGLASDARRGASGPGQMLTVKLWLGKSAGPRARGRHRGCRSRSTSCGIECMRPGRQRLRAQARRPAANCSGSASARRGGVGQGEPLAARRAAGVDEGSNIGWLTCELTRPRRAGALAARRMIDNGRLAARAAGRWGSRVERGVRPHWEAGQSAGHVGLRPALPAGRRASCLGCAALPAENHLNSRVRPASVPRWLCPLRSNAAPWGSLTLKYKPTSWCGSPSYSKKFSPVHTS